MKLQRRDLLKLGLAVPALAGPGCSSEDRPRDGWDPGELHHLLPTASHTAFNLKASFRHPQDTAPVLRFGRREVVGTRQDSDGRFWAFRAGGLEPGTRHALQLRHPAGHPLCDPWPLATLPAPDARPGRLRIVSFTCAGGPELPIPPSWFHAFKPAIYRRRLFDRMLERAPDLVIANGDHVYYDLPAMAKVRENPLGGLAADLLDGFPGDFDAALPVPGTRNERALIGVGDAQIARIYGTRFRSTPVFFITDDHDYFDNDDATPERVTFPPDVFHRALRYALQRLYFPEFIAPVDSPRDPPGQVEADGVRLSTHFGEMRYGTLFSGLLYDCGGQLGLGRGAGLVPPGAEAWLVDRTQHEDTAHLVHAPSHPMGWTAGKWREWYPDLLESTGSIVEAVRSDADGGKYMWQEGWWQQHQRLLAALCSQRHRRALVVSGDLHALGVARIERSGGLDLGRNPLHSVLSGAVGTGQIGWPSRARGVDPRTPEALGVTTLLALEERNGFTVLDFEGPRCTVRCLRCPDGYVAPERLVLATALRFDLTRA